MLKSLLHQTWSATRRVSEILIGRPLRALRRMGGGRRLLRGAGTVLTQLSVLVRFATARTVAAWWMGWQCKLAVMVVIPVVFIVVLTGWWLIWHRAVPELAPRQDSERSIIAVSLPPPAPRPEYVVEFAEGCVTDECHALMSRGLSALGSAPPMTIHEPVERAACQECHAPDSGGHTYPLLRTGDTLCSHCHQDGGPAGLGGQMFRHKAMFTEEGCLACHDPHTSAGSSLLVGQTVEQTCAQCHLAAEGEHQHWPYVTGQCSACHEPHGSDTVALLRTGGAGGVEDHCRMCHAETADAMAVMPHSHLNAEGSCLACHGAHATNWKRLQKFEPLRGCVSCHAEVAETVTGARVSHDAVLTGDQCISCHQPHASLKAMMLRDDHGSVCMSCHSEPVMATDGRRIPEMATTINAKGLIHGPVAAGNCAACHSIHGGEHARLLKELNPTVLVGGFDIRNYTLCFSCHDQELVLANSGEATEFRDGDVNLHRVHVQAGESARSCAACHAVHSSDRPRLIAETVAYDGSPWIMPMGFYLTPDGGGCAPGCHEPLQYRRSLRRNDSEKKEEDAR